jgi:hypothetical protein
MKKSILHIGGHADGEYRDIELVEMADGGWQLNPGYTLKELEHTDPPVFDRTGSMQTMETIVQVNETHYVREQICYGDDCIDVYIDYKLRASNPGALVKALLAGYRQPKGG